MAGCRATGGVCVPELEFEKNQSQREKHVVLETEQDSFEHEPFQVCETHQETVTCKKRNKRHVTGTGGKQVNRHEIVTVSNIDSHGPDTQKVDVGIM